MTIKPYILILLVAGVLVLGGCSHSRRVLLTGYWPPTNEMLVPFSQDETLNPDGWQGEDWQGTGYDVYAYFPTFPAGTKANPAGFGDFQVDYQSTWADFWRVTKKLRPEVILCYGRGAGPWEIEQNAVYRASWRDDYLEPRQPGCFCGLSRKYQDGEVLRLTLPADAIEAAVSEAVPELKAWVDRQGDPGDFLCNYLAFLAAEYQQSNQHCKAAGFIHVGPTVDLETAKKAQEVTLRTVILEVSD